MKLICFTHAGGLAEFYDGLAKTINSNIEVVAIEYPGHGILHEEKMLGSMDELSEKMYEEILDCMKKNKNEEYAIMGYSMGCLVAVTVLAKLVERKPAIGMPRHIFLASHEKEMNPNLKELMKTAAEEDIKAHTVEYGGIPDKLAHNKTFWRLYLPLYMNDYKVIDSYVVPDKLCGEEIAATVFYSKTDIDDLTIRKWDDIFKSCEYYEFEGHHFFIRNHYEEVADIIYNKLTKK